MGRIIKLKEVRKYIRPRTATVTGGAFDLFHVGHLSLLRRAARYGRPLVVLVASDRKVARRKGSGRPVVGERHRAELVSFLPFVDFLLVLGRPSHEDKYLKIIQPKHLVLGKEFLAYRQARAREIRKRFPYIDVHFAPRRRGVSTTKIIKRILESRRRDRKKIN